MTAPKFIPVGDAGLLIEFGDRIDREISARVVALDRHLAAAGIDGVVETMPSFRSLLVSFDPLRTDHAAIRAAAERLLEDGAQSAAPELPPKLWRFPAAYGGESGPDLEEVAAETGVAADRVIEAHLGVTHHVYMLGFLPGAPYLGDLPKEIDLPRRKDPRVAVPAGSVAIAVGLTVIYPVESPGGWRLIGRTPVPLFDLEADPPALLNPGDAIRFERVSAEEADSLRDRAERGAWRPEWEPREDV